jgi:hypothetical protein
MMISKAFFDDCGLALLSAWLICLLLAVAKDGCSTAPAAPLSTPS